MDTGWLRAGTPKYKIVLALRERGLKLETARALVDANGDVSRKARGRFVSQKELIRRIEALIKVTFEK